MDSSESYASNLVAQSWIEYVVKSFNKGRFEKSENPARVSYIHPGLCLLHYDRDRKPDICAIMSYFTEVRDIPMLFKGSNFLEFHEMKDTLIFINSCEFHIKREFYDMAISKWPLKVTASLGHMGNSSMSITVELSVPGSNIALATQRGNYVMVDPVIRKSKPHPDWYKEKYSERTLLTGPCRVETLCKPQETFHFEAKILWADTDTNDHASHSTYVYYTISGLRAALKLKAKQHTKKANGHQETTNDENICMVKGLRNFSPEIVKSGLKSVRICYTKESVEGDKLDIYLWQEEGNDLGVKALVEKEGEILCHIHLEYHGVASHL